MNSDLDCVLPLVIKPIRYTGGEMNSIVPPELRTGAVTESAVIRIVLCLPDVYEIGMSNYGLRILYGIMNRKPGVSCERVFTPWPDMGQQLRSAGMPLYALESKRPVSEFNILGFSLQSELAYTNVLYTLDLAGIPLRASERTNRHPLVVAGGPCCVSPLPMKPFIDCFVIGDGEEVLPEIAEVYRNWNRRHRDDLLAMLGRLEGVYVPAQHDGRPVRRRLVNELKEADFPYPPILPTCEIVHDRLTMEIARGCTRGCRFCQAGVLNRPYRYRGVDEIVRLAEQGIQATGWEEVSLLSLSSLDYPCLLELIVRLNSLLEKRKVAISLPSVRGEDFTPELAAALKLVRKTGLTFAPETLSPRLRALVNKDVPEAKIIESVQNAVAAGWLGVKLYFMIGLPGETESDVQEIRRFVEELSRGVRRAQIRFNLSPFVPKPHTPLQWAGFESVASLTHKIEQMKTGIKRRSIRAKWESPEISCIQAVLARGDERIAPVLERVYRSGGVFQEWTEYFTFRLWEQAIADCGLDMTELLRARTPGEPLPWDFVDLGVTSEYLRREWAKGQAGEFTPDCRLAECSDCGVCTPEQVRAQRDSAPRADGPTARDAEGIPWRLGDLAVKPVSEVDYGRYARKITGQEQLKLRFRLKYAVGEGFRYAAHLDVIRAFYRALRRSELPVAYSQGFAPRPVIAFGPPLPVGVTSAEEYLDLQMAGHYPGNLVRDLGPLMPRDLRLLEARPVFARSDSLGSALSAALYHIQSRGLSEEDRQAALERSRSANGVIGLRYSVNLSSSLVPGYDATELVLILSLAPGVKLFGVLPELFQRPENAVRCWRIERQACYTVRDGKLVSPMEES
jgi:radical SAM family uncharacterized protein